MIFVDYPFIHMEDYKIPDWIEPEYMKWLLSNWFSQSAQFDRKIHDYIILAGSWKFTKTQIKRCLYLSKYSFLRLTKRYQESLIEWEKIKKKQNGCETVS